MLTPTQCAVIVLAAIALTFALVTIHEIRSERRRRDIERLRGRR